MFDREDYSGVADVDALVQLRLGVSEFVIPDEVVTVLRHPRAGLEDARRFLRACLQYLEQQELLKDEWIDYEYKRLNEDEYGRLVDDCLRSFFQRRAITITTVRPSGLFGDGMLLKDAWNQVLVIAGSEVEYVGVLWSTSA